MEMNTMQDIMYSELPAPKMMHIFREMHTKEPNYKYLYDIELFIHSARERNNTELIALLLEEKRLFKFFSPENISKLLTNAIATGCHCLVKWVLQTSSSKDLVKESRIVVTSMRKSSLESLSAVEHACLLNRPDILRLLADYDVSFNKYNAPEYELSRARSVVKDVSPRMQYELSVDHMTPLHIVVRMANRRDRFKKGRLSLPNAVQTILAADKDVVNVLNERGFTALNLLVKQLKYLMSGSLIGASRDYDSITETVALLLRSGSVTTGPEEHNPLDTLMWLATSEDYLFQTLSADHCVQRLSLLADLIKMILQNGGQRTNLSHPFVPCHVKLFTCCGAMLLRFQAEKISVSSDVFRNMMELWADVFQSFAMSRREVDYTDLRPNTLAKDVLFMKAYAAIAGYSRQEKNSTKLMRQFLAVTNVEHLFRISLVCFKRKDDLGVTLVEFSNMLDAVKTYLEIPRPVSLQDAAKNAILRAMSYRCLCRDFRLPLPRVIADYVLLPTV